MEASEQHMETLTKCGGVGEFVIRPGLKQLKVLKVAPLSKDEWKAAAHYFKKRPAAAPTSWPADLRAQLS